MQKSRLFFWVILSALSLHLAACSSLQRPSRGAKLPHKQGTFDDSNNEIQESGDGAGDFQEAPIRPPVVKVPKVGVILGPGMALSLAHAGVLKAFDESKVPVEHIVGIGWGSIVGALYSKQGMSNDAQWRIYKLKEEDLPGKSFFSSSIKADSVKSMRGFLSDGFQKTVMEKSKIPFSCPTMTLKSGKTHWQRRGLLVDAVSRCISFPPLFRPFSGNLAGDLFSMQASVEYLKQRGIDLIVYVDVLHAGDLLSADNLEDNYASFILWNEIRRLSVKSHAIMGEVIRVDAGPFKLMDFDKKQTLVKRGESAGRTAVKMIVKKYGF